MNTLPQIPWSTTGSFVLGLIGVLGVVGLGLWIWNQGRKAFGRVPPLNEDLDNREKALRRQIYASEKTQNEKREALEKGFRELVAGHHKDCERRLSLLEENYSEMQSDRIRKWSELSHEISQLNATLAFIRGKFERESPSI